MEETLTMLKSSFWIMIFGMVIVYVVLMILIYAVQITGKIVSRTKYGKAEPPAPPTERSGSNDKSRDAAIAAAVNKYRSEK